MSTPHATPEQLEAWATGELPPEAAAALEAHVGACPACASALAAEARLEERLHALASGAFETVRPLRRLGPPLAVATALTALAAALLLLVGRDPAPPPGGAPRVVDCQDPGSAPACVARAHFDGVVAVGPGNLVAVPRYDELPAAAANPGGGR